MARTTASRDGATDELRAAMLAFFAAQRRLRGRDTKRGGLTFAQWQLVRCLHEGGEQPARVAAAELALSPASISEALDHLAEVGLVERVRSEADRRVVLNRLTDAGREVVAATQEEMDARWRDALADLSARQLADGAQVLRRMAGVLDEL